MRTITNRVAKGKRFQVSFHLMTTEDVAFLFGACAQELKYRKSNPEGAMNPEASDQTVKLSRD